MGDELNTTNAEATPMKSEAPAVKDAPKKAETKATRKTAKKAPKKAGKSAAKKAAKAEDMPMWQKMGWNKPGRKGGKKAGAKKASKASKAPKAAKATKATKTTPAVKKALARSGTAIAAGSDVRSLLVAAIKQAVDTADYENARQILGLLEKQKR
jgi:hypothetical protein